MLKHNPPRALSLQNARPLPHRVQPISDPPDMKKPEKIGKRD